MQIYRKQLFREMTESLFKSGGSDNAVQRNIESKQIFLKLLKQPWSCALICILNNY